MLNNTRRNNNNGPPQQLNDAQQYNNRNHERSSATNEYHYSPYTPQNLSNSTSYVHQQRKKFHSENFDGRYINEYSTNEGWSSHFTRDERNTNEANSFIPNDSPGLMRRERGYSNRMESPLVNEELDVAADSPKALDPTPRDHNNDNDDDLPVDDFPTEDARDQFESPVHGPPSRSLHTSQQEINHPLYSSHSRDHIYNMQRFGPNQNHMTSNSESETHIKRKTKLLKYNHAL